MLTHVVYRAVFFVILAVLLHLSAIAQQPPVMVEVGVAGERILRQEAPLVATVEAVRRSIVAAEQDGLVVSRTFEEGDSVKAGQELVRKDTKLTEAARTVVFASLESARGQLTQAIAEQENALAEAARIEQLRQQGVVTEKEYRDTETIRRVSQARVLARRAEVQQQEAELVRLDLIIAKSVVRAPFDGAVAIRRAELGQWLAQGDPVAELVSIDPVHVAVPVPERLISKVTPDASLDITIDALPGETFKGEVDHILPVADNASRTFTVKLKVANPGGKLRPGFLARVVIATSTDAKALTVPRAAVVSRGGSFVVAVVREGKAAIVPVKYLQLDGDDIVIEGEIRAGETVVTRGNEALMGGETLVPVTLAGQKQQQ